MSTRTIFGGTPNLSITRHSKPISGSLAASADLSLSAGGFFAVQRGTDHRVKGLDEVQEPDPRLPPVLTPLPNELFECVGRVSRATPGAKTTLRLVVDVVGRLEDLLEPHVHYVGHYFICDLEQHYAPVVGWVALITLLRQNFKQPGLPLRRHLLRLPKVEHDLVHEAKALRRGAECFPEASEQP